MASERSSIVYHTPARVLRRRRLLEFARLLETDVAEGRPFCCVVTDDDEMRRLNRQFRHKDDATDVLSFPACGAGSQPAAASQSASVLSLGELAISFDRAREQAAGFGHSTEDEVRVLMLHGVLHLTGMDHERDGGEMQRAEQRWRRRLRLPDGLIERSSR